MAIVKLMCWLNVVLFVKFLLQRFSHLSSFFNIITSARLTHNTYSHTQMIVVFHFFIDWTFINLSALFSCHFVKAFLSFPSFEIKTKKKLKLKICNAKYNWSNDKNKFSFSFFYIKSNKYSSNTLTITPAVSFIRCWLFFASQFILQTIFEFDAYFLIIFMDKKRENNRNRPCNGQISVVFIEIVCVSYSIIISGTTYGPVNVLMKSSFLVWLLENISRLFGFHW